MREIADLREQNQELEGEMSKARTDRKTRGDWTLRRRLAAWAGVWISDKLPRNGDFILCVPGTQWRSCRAENSDRQQGQIDNRGERHREAGARRKGTLDRCRRAGRPRGDRSFDRLTGSRDGAARTESGCSERTRQWIVRDLDLLQARSSRGCESKASTCWSGTRCSRRNCAGHSLRSTASRRN